MSTKLLWHWDDTHEQAFQTMCQLLLEHNLKLSTLNHQYPLHFTWIKHTSGKGAVSQFVIDTLSAFDYNMHYIKGPRTLTCGGTK